MEKKNYKELYEQALQRAKQINNTPYTAHWDIMKEVIDELFPELKKSEDERIWKNLIEFFLHYPDHEIDYYGLKADSVISWLEKQGMQKPADKVEPKFKVGQTIKKEGFNLGFTIAKIEDGFYYNYEGDYFPFTDQDNWELAEQKHDVDQHSLPTSDDSSLPTLDESIYHPCTEEVCEQKPTWSEEDEKYLNATIAYLRDAYSKDKVDFRDTAKNCVNWLRSLKDRVLPQPKQEWGEEDEKMLNLLPDIIDRKIPVSIKMMEVAKDWLKSLRPQNRWKPSLAQLNALSVVAKGNAPDDIEEIKSLLNDLKKLREE